MVEELWGMFPRLVERNIEGLLDEAEPNALRKLQIFRAIKNNGLSDQSVEEFLAHLGGFYSRPRAERRKSQFDACLERPMDHDLYSLFQVDFRTAVVPDESLYNLANWAYNMIRVGRQVSGAFMSQDVLLKTFRRITNPARHEKAEGIKFSDFCAAWKKTVHALFGHHEDENFGKLLQELEWLDRESGASLKTGRPETETALVDGVYLSRVEMDWVLAVREAALQNAPAPVFSAATTSDKPYLKDFSRIVALYHASRTSKVPEIVKNRDRIRATVLDRVSSLLGEDKKLAG